MSDIFRAARQVADAVLYEGYVLYPYRASSVKNQVRWQFGVVAPASAVAVDPSERATVRAECVVEATASTALTVVLRCLQVRSREVEARGASGGFTPVATLHVGEDTWSAWDEAVEQEVVVGPLALCRLLEAPHVHPVRFGARKDVELVGSSSAPAGRVVRRRWVVEGRLVLRARPLAGDRELVGVSVEVVNATRYRPSARSADRRQQMLRRSFVGTHLLLGVEGGSFVSAVDPPGEAAGAVAQCASDGLYPVLIGAEHRAPVVLAAPIVLYDDPAVAPESPGDMFDATEIDEILALRVLTLTDDEKRQARHTDPRAAQVVDRCDAMTPDTFAALHGTMRSVGATGSTPWWDPAADASVDPATDTTVVHGVSVGAGTRVVLRPGRRSDAQDMFLAGKSATVSAVVHDVDGGVHLAVAVDDDPASDMHEWYGRYRYFAPDEVDLIGEGQ